MGINKYSFFKKSEDSGNHFNKNPFPREVCTANELYILCCATIGTEKLI